MQDFFTRGKINSMTGSLVLAALTACGGGGGGGNNATPGGTTSTTISGKVIDGYIRGATVYWDCNSNNQLDAGEISTITTAGGNYTIADKSSVGCELTASVGADAIDESRPYTSGQSYTMKAVPGRSDLITPFSTLIAGQVSSSGITAAKAEADIASILGINSSLLVDYKANNVDPNAVKLATSAAVIADSLYQNQKNAIFTDGVTKTYDDIKTRFAQSGFVDSISRGLAPFINTYQSISDKLSKLVSGDPNLRLYRKVNFSDPAANNVLDVIALEVNSRNAAKYGAVNWGAFSNDELKNYLKEIHRINALSSDSAAQSNIQALQGKRQKLFSNASLRLNKVVGNDGDLVGVYGFFTNDPGASIDFALEMVSISIDTAIDVTTIAGTRPPIGRPSDYAKTHKSLNKMLDNFAFMTSAVKCAKASTSIDDSEVDMTAKITTLVGDCGSFFADVAADATTIARTRSVTQAASGAMSAVGGFGSATDPKQKALTALKMYATALGLVHDVVEPFVKDPITTRFLAAADLGIQYLNASAAGMELEIAATEKLDQGLANAIALYEREIDSAWRSYFISSMQINADFHFEIVDSTLVKPVVTGITPLAIKSGITTTFTITGQNLPLTAVMSIADGSCQTPTSRTSSGFVVVCTAGGPAGNKVATIKTDTQAAGGRLIDNQKTIAVTGSSADIGYIQSYALNLQGQSQNEVRSGLVICVPKNVDYGYDSAVVSGPGLPGAGIRLIDSWLVGLCLSRSIIDSAGNEKPTGLIEYIFENLPQINEIPAGSVYTVQKYSGAIATGSPYHVPLGSKVLAEVEMPRAMFPSLAFNTYEQLCPGDSPTTAQWRVSPTGTSLVRSGLDCLGTVALTNILVRDGLGREIQLRHAVPK